MRVQKYVDNDIQLWNSFIKNSKNGIFMFERDFMEYHKDRFVDNSLLFYDEDKLVALFPASIKDGVLASHGGLTYGGFITGNDMKQHHMNDCFNALREYANENRIKEIIYKHIPHIYHKQPARAPSNASGAMVTLRFRTSRQPITRRSPARRRRTLLRLYSLPQPSQRA